MRDFLSRWAYRAITLIFVVIAAYVLWKIYERNESSLPVDVRLPALFHWDAYKPLIVGWACVLAFLAFGSVLWLRRIGRRASVQPPDDSDSEAAQGLAYGPIPAPPGAERGDEVYLLIGPSSRAVERFLGAAGLRSRSRSLLMTEPIRGVLLNLGDLAEPSEEGTDAVPIAIEDVGRAIRANSFEAPKLRGIFVVVPVDDLDGPGWNEAAGRVESDLRAVRQSTELSVPAYLIVTGMEHTTGFLEFAELRGRQAEFGVTLPPGRTPQDNEPERSLARYGVHIRRRAMRFVRKRFPDRQACARIYQVAIQFQALRPALTSFCAVAFPCGDPDQAYLRGVHLTATGTAPDEQAYALFALSQSMRRDRSEVSWSAGALEKDRDDRRRAWRVAVGGGVAALSVWLYIVRGLQPPRVASWSTFGLIVLTWVVSLVLMKRAWPSASRTGRGLNPPAE